MNLPSITLVSFGHFEKEFLEQTAEAVGRELNFPVNIKEGRIDLSEFYDPPRRQYNGNSLLKLVDAMSYPDSIRVIGLFSVDLFVPILTFIFGQAFLGGRTGIASLYRLSNELYGIAPDNNLLFERFIKEVIHELGHTFGLIHCHQPSCVMRPSTYVEDIDQKERHFCSSCRKGLEGT
jgi:archaemetzincin